jgi:hypothetical protein
MRYGHLLNLVYHAHVTGILRDCFGLVAIYFNSVTPDHLSPTLLTGFHPIIFVEVFK